MRLSRDSGLWFSIQRHWRDTHVL